MCNYFATLGQQILVLAVQDCGLLKHSTVSVCWVFCCKRWAVLPVCLYIDSLIYFKAAGLEERITVILQAENFYFYSVISQHYSRRTHLCSSLTHQPHIAYFCCTESVCISLPLWVLCHDSYGIPPPRTHIRNSFVFLSQTFLPESYCQHLGGVVRWKRGGLIKQLVRMGRRRRGGQFLLCRDFCSLGLQ